MEERLQLCLPQTDQFLSRGHGLNAGMQRLATCWSLSQECRQLLSMTLLAKCLSGKSGKA